MNRALLEFPGTRAKPRTKGRCASAGVSPDLMSRLEELRYDLKCVEQAILDVERLVFAPLPGRSFAAGASALRKIAISRTRRKYRLIAVPRAIKGFPVTPDL